MRQAAKRQRVGDPGAPKAKRAYRRGKLTNAQYWSIVQYHFDWGTGSEGGAAGKTARHSDIAQAVGCHRSVVSRTLERWHADGNPLPARSRKQSFRRLGNEKTAFLVGVVDEHPDIYLHEIQERFKDEYGPRAAPSKPTLCRALRENDRPLKVLEHRALERDRSKRWQYRDAIRLLPNPERLVFLDESHFDNRVIRRRRGRARRGQPAVVFKKLGHLKNTSLLAAVTVNGMIQAACKAYEDGINHDVLIEWARYHLLPNLPPGCTLVLDNASIHHCDAFIKLLDAAKRDLTCPLVDYLFLSPFSPDYNPIEFCFSEIKQFVRRYQDEAMNDLHGVLARAVRAVTAAHARNYYLHVGLKLPALPLPAELDVAAEEGEEDAVLLGAIVAVLQHAEYL